MQVKKNCPIFGSPNFGIAKVCADRHRLTTRANSHVWVLVSTHLENATFEPNFGLAGFAGAVPQTP